MNDTIEKFGIFAISVKIAHSTSRNLENRKNIEKENKLVNLRYLGYINANLATLMLIYMKIFLVVAEIGLQVPKSTQTCVLINLPIFAILQKFSAVTPRQIFRINSPWGA